MSTQTIGYQSIITFGKYKGRTVEYVIKNDVKYINWAKNLQDPGGEMAEFVNFLRMRDMCREQNGEGKPPDPNQTSLDAFFYENERASQHSATPRTASLESRAYTNNGHCTPLTLGAGPKNSKTAERPNPEDISFVNDPEYRAERERLSPSLKDMLDALSKGPEATKTADDSPFDGVVELEGTLALVLYSDREFYLTYTKSPSATWWTVMLPPDLNKFLSKLGFKTNSRQMGKDKVVTYNAEYYSTILKSLRGVVKDKNSIEPIPNFVLRTFPDFSCFAREASLVEPTRKILYRLRDEYTVMNMSRMPSLVGEPLWESLMPFQKQGVLFGLEKNGRVLIGDEMGLGKTLQALAIAAFYQGDWPLLIICPSSLRYQWKDQCMTWLPHLVEEEEIWVVDSSKPQTKKKRKRKRRKTEEEAEAATQSPARTDHSSPFASLKTTPVTSDKHDRPRSDHSSSHRSDMPNLFSEKSLSAKSNKSLSAKSNRSLSASSDKSTPIITIDDDSRDKGALPFTFNDFDPSAYRYNETPSNLVISPFNFRPSLQTFSSTPSNYVPSPLNLNFTPVDSNCTSHSNLTPPNMVVTPKLHSLFVTYNPDVEVDQEGNMLHPYKVVIISYDMMVRIKEMGAFKAVICDESHYLKNQRTQRVKRIVPELRQARRVIMLSGTPALNMPIELFAQLEAIIPGFSSFSVFVERYCKKQYNHFTNKTDFKDAKHTNELHLFLINTVMIRRLKRDVLMELPPKTRSKIPIQISDKLSRTTFKLLGQTHTELELTQDVDVESLDSGLEAEGEVASTCVMQRLFMLTGRDKVKGVCKYVEDILESDDKFIIFAHHRFMLDAIEQTLKTNRTSYIRIDGSTRVDQRPALIKKFQESSVTAANTTTNLVNKMFNVKPEAPAEEGTSDVRIALLSISCCGVGLNLNTCSNVIFAELYWVPGVLLQAEDRVHRIGTKSRFISISYLIALNSIDEVIWRLINRKYQSLTSTLDGSSATIAVSNKKKATTQTATVANAQAKQ